MLMPSQGVRILVATQPVDFRKGHDGLAALVQSRLAEDPFTGTVFVFRSKRADRLKILFWDGSGLVMAYKRLEESTFTWPAIRDGAMTLRPARNSRSCLPAWTGAGCGHWRCADRLWQSDSPRGMTGQRRIWRDMICACPAPRPSICPQSPRASAPPCWRFCRRTAR